MTSNSRKTESNHSKILFTLSTNLCCHHTSKQSGDIHQRRHLTASVLCRCVFVDVMTATLTSISTPLGMLSEWPMTTNYLNRSFFGSSRTTSLLEQSLRAPFDLVRCLSCSRISRSHCQHSTCQSNQCSDNERFERYLYVSDRLGFNMVLVPILNLWKHAPLRWDNVIFNGTRRRSSNLKKNPLYK